VSTVDLARLQCRDRLVVHFLVFFLIGRRLVAARGIGSSQRFVSSDGAAWSQRLGDVGRVVRRGNGERLWQAIRALALPAIAHLVVVHLVIVVLAVGLSLPACGREEAFLTLSPASHAGRIVWVIYRAKIWRQTQAYQQLGDRQTTASDVPHRTLRRLQGMQAWYVRVCWAFWLRGGGEALEPAVDMVVVDYGRLAPAERWRALALIRAGIPPRLVNPERRYLHAIGDECAQR
jgi:hypothetical protein